ncbi:hypothetical protein GCM10023187_11970 [Nibrella viscosa]|uniref:DUF6883 domain-containing protein n=1 Tax=Nibrella viscosa TaxID=1084524 RepID=A0ABP8K2X9_9BACT
MSSSRTIIIDPEKITKYLLIWKAENDKSVFLKKLGYTLENWQELEQDIRKIAENDEPISSRSTPFGGSLYKVVGKLRNFGTVTIWMVTDENANWRFVTFLYPEKS